jgi:aconitate hydratase
MANLCNYGILPLVFANPDDYNFIKTGSIVSYPQIRQNLAGGAVELPVKIDEKQIRVFLHVSERMRRELLEGGALNFVRTAKF